MDPFCVPNFENHCFKTFVSFRSHIWIGVRYKLPKDIAKWFEIAEDTGHIKVKNSMDRESPFIKDEEYTVLIEAYDNGNIQPLLNLY